MRHMSLVMCHLLPISDMLSEEKPPALLVPVADEGDKYTNKQANRRTLQLIDLISLEADSVEIIY